MTQALAHMLTAVCAFTWIIEQLHARVQVLVCGHETVRDSSALSRCNCCSRTPDDKWNIERNLDMQHYTLRRTHRDAPCVDQGIWVSERWCLTNTDILATARRARIASRKIRIVKCMFTRRSCSNSHLMEAAGIDAVVEKIFSKYWSYNHGVLQPGMIWHAFVFLGLHHQMRMSLSTQIYVSPRQSKDPSLRWMNCAAWIPSFSGFFFVHGPCIGWKPIIVDPSYICEMNQQ